MFYNKNNFSEHGLIYKTNIEIYKTADNVDTIISGVMGYSMYKVCKNIYALALG